MARVLIINECYSDNIGDQAIAGGVSWLFDQHGHEVLKKDFSFRSEVAAGNLSSPSWFKSKIPKIIKFIFFFLKNLKRAVSVSSGLHEFAVIGGGQLILGQSNFPWAMFVWVNALKLYDKKVYLVGVGAGTKLSFLERVLYKQSLSRVDGIFVRDTASMSFLQRELKVKSTVCPDVAYALRSDFMGGAVRQRVCVVCITDYSVYLRYSKEMSRRFKTKEAYLDEWAEIVRFYEAAGYKVVLSGTTAVDLYYAQQLSGIVGCEVLFCENDRVPSYYEFMALCSSSELVVAGRMHALILAHISGAKPCPYYISKKIETFSSEYLSKDLDQINSEIEVSLKELMRFDTGV